MSNRTLSERIARLASVVSFLDLLNDLVDRGLDVVESVSDLVALCAEVVSNRFEVAAELGNLAGDDDPRDGGMNPLLSFGVAAQ
jgi:hypothetical protein